MDNEENGRDVTVVIKEGDSVYQIGKTLKKKGLIDDAKIFVAQEMLSSYKGKQQPGTYILSTSMTPDEMMEIWQEKTQKDSRTRPIPEEKQKKEVLKYRTVPVHHQKKRMSLLRMKEENNREL